MIEMIITTPLGEKVKLTLVDRAQSDNLIAESLETTAGEFVIAFKKKMIYQLKNGEVLLDYTLKDYMLLLDSYDEAKKILNNDFYGIIIINKAKNIYYYCFSVYQEFFNKYQPSLEKEVAGSFPKYYINFENKKCPYHTIHQNNGILFYFERVEGVMQGTWYSHLKDFRYFYAKGC